MLSFVKIYKIESYDIWSEVKGYKSERFKCQIDKYVANPEYVSTEKQNPRVNDKNASE